ncbi:MAG: Lrp/AsnC ligand binding domain-containing protein [Nakamurella sp.]
MVTAIVLIDIEPTEISEAAQAIADLAGVQAVYSCAGDVDVIAVVQADDHEGIASIIPEHIGRVRGVKSTVTHIAFRSYSKRDGDDAFSIGMHA